MAEIKALLSPRYLQNGTNIFQCFQQDFCQVACKLHRPKICLDYLPIKPVVYSNVTPSAVSYSVVIPLVVLILLSDASVD
jgi:hypothetical protein